MSSQKVKLDICGSTYVVSTNDTEEYLLGLAERLDADMNQVMMDAPNASVTSAAVITALAYLDEAEKSAFSADNMRMQIQGYLEDAAKARTAAEQARRETEKLRRELAYYQSRENAPKSVSAQAQEPFLNYGQSGAPVGEQPREVPAAPEQMEGQMSLEPDD